MEPRGSGDAAPSQGRGLGRGKGALSCLELTQRVYELVAQIPKGRVMTYGQIAALCGAAWAAWEVGQIAHTGPDDLPWQRVVNKKGGLALGWPNGGREAHKAILE